MNGATEQVGGRDEQVVGNGERAAANRFTRDDVECCRLSARMDKSGSPEHYGAPGFSLWPMPYGASGDRLALTCSERYGAPSGLRWPIHLTGCAGWFLVLLAEASGVEWYALFVVEAKQAHPGTKG